MDLNCAVNTYLAFVFSDWLMNSVIFSVSVNERWEIWNAVVNLLLMNYVFTWGLDEHHRRWWLVYKFLVLVLSALTQRNQVDLLTSQYGMLLTWILLSIRTLLLYSVHRLMNSVTFSVSVNEWWKIWNAYVESLLVNRVYLRTDKHQRLLMTCLQVLYTRS